MINVKDKTCMHPDCKKLPTFNFEGQTKGMYCSEHKEPNMINVKHEICMHPDCKKLSIFNFEGQYKGIYCSEHKEPNMINVKDKTCSHPDCKKIPTFNFEGQTKGMYCSEHKEPNMIDVKHKICMHPDCKKRPTYGLPGQSSTYCFMHKKEGYMTHSKKTCKVKSCKEIALYNNNSKVPKRCELHKQDDDINLIERICKSCSLPNIVNEMSLCTYCEPNKFLGFRLGKQREVKCYLEANNYEFDSYDEAILYNECDLKSRPDFVFKYDTHIIVLEVDELAHKNNNELCECTRMVNISQAFMKPTIFIRYNPDSYHVKNKSVEGPTKNKRLQCLSRWIDHLSNLTMDEITKYGYCSMIRLYFDDFKESNVHPEIITHYTIDKHIVLK